MEGYTDVIVAHQFGFENAVAVLGTALAKAISAFSSVLPIGLSWCSTATKPGSAAPTRC